MSLIGVDISARNSVAFVQFEAELARMQVGWFEDTIKLANWDHVRASYIQTSPIYDHATAEAQRRGWPFTRLRGEHLHPTLKPSETANAIISMSRQLAGSAHRDAW